jgi:hypothetical protein
VEKSGQCKTGMVEAELRRFCMYGTEWQIFSAFYSFRMDGLHSLRAIPIPLPVFQCFLSNPASSTLPSLPTYPGTASSSHTPSSNL